ncbi:MAG: hypothetical protein ABW217_00775 [Polyangiaceae bacterium]
MTRTGLIASSALLALSGCIAAPAVPAGPLQGTSLGISGAYGYALAPAEVTAQGSGGRARFSDAAGDAVNFPLVPARIGARIGIIDFIDLGGDRGWYEGGFDVRAGLPENMGPLPFALGFGMRRGSWGWLNGEGGAVTRDARAHAEQRLRLEIYPRLAAISVGFLNGIAALGVSWGPRYHELFGPYALATPPESPNGGSRPDRSWGTPRFHVLREETRLELALGAEARTERGGALSVVLMPYWVTDGRTVSHAECTNCADWQVVAYDSNFGISLFVTASFTKVFHRISE